MRKKLLIATLVTVLLVPLLAAIALGALLLRTDLTPLKGIVVEQVRRATGRELAVKGELTWRFSLSPTVTVNDVAFANASWGSYPHMVTAQYLEVEVALLPLLEKRLELTGLVLRGAEVFLETNPQGRGNWILVRDTGSSSSATMTKAHDIRPPATIDILIMDSTLTLRKLSGSGQTVLKVDRWTLSADSPDAPLAVQFDGSWNGHGLSWSGTTGRLIKLTGEGIPFDVDLSVIAFGMTGTVKGTVTAPLRTQGIELALAAQAADLTELRSAFGESIPELGPTDLTLHASGGIENLTLSDIRTTLPAGEISGTAHMRLGDPRPAVQATLTSSGLNLSALVPPASKRPPDQHGHDRWLALELPFWALSALDLSLAWEATGLRISEDLLIDHLIARAQIAEGELTLSELKVDADAFDLDGTVTIDAGAPLPEIETKMTLQTLDPAWLLGPEPSETAHLSVAAQYTLAARGRSLRDLIRAVHGSAQVAYREDPHGNRVTLRMQRDVIPDDASVAPVPVELTAAGTWAGQPVQVSGQLGAPAALLPGSEPYPVTLNATVAGLTINLAGTVTEPLADQRFNLAVRAQVPNLAVLRPWLGNALPALAPARVAMNAVGSRSAVRLSALQARAGRARVAGTVELHRDGPRPRLVGELSLTDLDISQWRNPGVAAQKPSLQPADGAVLDRSLPFAALHGFDAALKLSANRLVLPQGRINAMQLELTLENGQLRLSELNASSPLFDTNGHLTVDITGAVPQVTADLHVPRIDPSLLAGDRGALQPRATIDAAYRVAAHGVTLRSLIDSLHGSAHLSYRDTSTDGDVLIRATRGSGGRDVPVEVEAEGRWAGQPIAATGSIGAPVKLLPATSPYPVNLEVNALGITSTVSGVVAKPLAGTGWKLDVEARAANLQGLQAWLGDVISLTDPVQLSTGVTGAWDALHLSDLHVAGWGGTLDGQLTLITGDDRPRVRGHLTLRDLALPKLLSKRSMTPAATAAQAQEDTVFSHQPINYEPIRLLNGDVTVRGLNVAPTGELAAAGGLIKEVTARLLIEDGRLTVNVLKAAAVDGDFVAEWEVNSTLQPPEVRLQIQSQHYQLGSVLARTELAGIVEGTLALDVDLQGRGNSVAEIAGGLDGHMHALMGKGRARIQRWDNLVGGIRAALGHLFTADATTSDINCALYDAEFKDGRTTALRGIIDTEYSTVVVDGEVDLKTETLNITGTPAAKGVTLSVAVPVKYTGTLAAPQYSLDPSGTLVKLTELLTSVAFPPLLLVKYGNLGTDTSNPCVALAAGSQQPSGLTEGVGRAAGQAVRDVGRALETFLRGEGATADDGGQGAD